MIHNHDIQISDFFLLTEINFGGEKKFIYLPLLFNIEVIKYSIA